MLFRNKSGVLASFSFSIVLLTVEHILSIGEDHEMCFKSDKKKKKLLTLSLDSFLAKNVFVKKHSGSKCDILRKNKCHVML